MEVRGGLEDTNTSSVFPPQIKPNLARAVPLPHQPAALQDLKQRPMEECPPGFYLSGKVCLSCKAGEDYTSHNNSLDRCRSCLVCKGDQVQKSPCTTTSNTVCECKPGTFWTQNTPEFCQTCRDKCTEEEDEEIPCTPLSDRKCVPKATGGTRALKIVGIISIIFTIVMIIIGIVVWKRKEISDYIKRFWPAAADVLYEMLLKWLQWAGQRASINALLDALQTLEETFARDTIENHLVLWEGHLWR
ncbi:PREDICTED: tumor necrosis factor receptor superfamily member 10B-like [Dipodomys ordii]|uniref:Tumor necrosis factor receptor superfamily member 10B-like n=1 Tax=Dipodomys ordii TaxID=10020 RepID=A0A1S3GM21_DIPOR|nr:PREDICTED: tumor necrosis factor receptor superfamily member 10B-like [Dipodomys ordii]